MEKYTKEKWTDKSMKSINIHGKEYYEVKERVQEFHRRYPDGSIETEIIELTETRFITRSIVKPYKGIDITYTGLACEVLGKGGFSGSELECCETSSVGRALGFLNIGITNSIASADEVRNAKRNQKDNDKLTSQLTKNLIEANMFDQMAGSMVKRIYGVANDSVVDPRDGRTWYADEVGYR